MSSLTGFFDLYALFVKCGLEIYHPYKYSIPKGICFENISSMMVFIVINIPSLTGFDDLCALFVKFGLERYHP
jgi:hypothetical protein